MENNEPGFIRAQEIIQNDDGQLFSIAYFDRGYFRIKVFDLENKDVA
jgi:hypothetical protein